MQTTKINQPITYYSKQSELKSRVQHLLLESACDDEPAFAGDELNGLGFMCSARNAIREAQPVRPGTQIRRTRREPTPLSERYDCPLYDADEFSTKETRVSGKSRDVSRRAMVDAARFAARSSPDMSVKRSVRNFMRDEGLAPPVNQRELAAYRAIYCPEVRGRIVTTRISPQPESRFKTQADLAREGVEENPGPRFFGALVSHHQMGSLFIPYGAFLPRGSLMFVFARSAALKVCKRYQRNTIAIDDGDLPDIIVCPRGWFPMSNILNDVVPLLVGIETNPGPATGLDYLHHGAYVPRAMSNPLMGGHRLCYLSVQWTIGLFMAVTEGDTVYDVTATANVEVTRARRDKVASRLVGIELNPGPNNHRESRRGRSYSPSAMCASGPLRPKEVAQLEVVKLPGNSRKFLCRSCGAIVLKTGDCTYTHPEIAPPCTKPEQSVMGMGLTPARTVPAAVSPAAVPKPVVAATEPQSTRAAKPEPTVIATPTPNPSPFIADADGFLTNERSGTWQRDEDGCLVMRHVTSGDVSAKDVVAAAPIFINRKGALDGYHVSPIDKWRIAAALLGGRGFLGQLADAACGLSHWHQVAAPGSSFTRPRFGTDPEVVVESSCVETGPENRLVTDRNVTVTAASMMVDTVTASVKQVDLVALGFNACVIGAKALTLALTFGPAVWMSYKHGWNRALNYNVKQLAELFVIGKCGKVAYDTLPSLVPVIKTEVQTVTYVPHALSAALREFKVNDAKSVCDNVDSKLLRLATLPMKDADALSYHHGTARMAKILAGNRQGFPLASRQAPLAGSMTKL